MSELDPDAELRLKVANLICTYVWDDLSDRDKREYLEAADVLIGMIMEWKNAQPR